MAVARVKVPPGTSEARVAVSGSASSPVLGYHFAIGHDRDAVSLVDVKVSELVAEHGADFVLTNIDNDAEQPFGAILVALDGRPPFGDVLPIDLSEAVELATFTYELQPGVQPGQATDLQLRHRVFGIPPVAAIFVDEDLNSIRPEVHDGEIRVVSTDFIRGDCSHDGFLDITDAVNLLLYLFQGTVVPPCLDSCDANDDGELNLTDSLATLTFLFSGGVAPPAPYPNEGVDPTPDPLTCLEVPDLGEQP